MLDEIDARLSIKTKPGGAGMKNGPDAADNIYNSLIFNIQLLCLNVSVEKLLFFTGCSARLPPQLTVPPSADLVVFRPRRRSAWCLS